MNKRADFFFRVRLATLAKSAQALSEADGRRLYDRLQDVDKLVGYAKALGDTAKSGRIPSEHRGDPMFDRVVLLKDPDKSLDRYTSRKFQRATFNILAEAAQLARWIIRFKSIPKGQAKKLERAAKPFLSARRAPRKPVGWLAKNGKNLDFLLTAFKTWEDKGDDSPDKYTVGPFTVHNTLQLEGDDLEKTNKVIEAATKFVKGSSIPGAGKAAYGDVFVVGKLQGHNTLAWYNFRDDNIYLRPLLKANMDATHSLAHEIGHRYWRKQVPREVQNQWARYHSGKRYERPDVMDQVKEVMASIRPGEPVPVPIKGWERGGPPIIVGLENTSNPNRAELVFEMPRGKKKGKQGRIRLMSIANFVGQQESRKISFPTDYASTSPEEHFAESFALYAMKKLRGPHKENFEKIIVKR
jgi:hypothetical protein